MGTWGFTLALFQLVWRQLEPAFFSALTSVGALFFYTKKGVKHMAFLFFLYLLIAAAFIVLDYFIAKWFFEAAEEKGYHNKKYFWICFWLGWVGWVLVCALPDRGNTPQVRPDELPDL